MKATPRAWILATAMASAAAAATLEIDAKLLQATPTPEPERIIPYPRALCTYLYQVEKVRAGSYPDDKILVVKWAVWKNAKLQGLPATTGSTEKLKLHPWTDHPEFARERIIDAIGERDLVIYYDPLSKPAPAGALSAGHDHEMAAGVVRGGAPGWLFLADELRHADTGRFWQNDWKTVSRAQVDPSIAMLDFQRRLAAAKVKLLVVPVPMKVAVYPDHLRAHTEVEPQAGFVRQLRQAGLNVLDLEPVFAHHRKDPRNRPLYLAQDSHWSPEGCRLAAQEIARRIQPTTPAPPASVTWLPDQTMEIRGDLAKLVTHAKLPPEQITLDRVRYGKPGAAPPWSDPASPIVLLGDSHVTVFSEGNADLHGSGAGLPDYLLMRLGRPVEVVASHGDGIHQARVNLYRRATRNPNPGTYWQGKEWLVWVFAAREFTRAPQWSADIPVTPPANK